jgi:hypothetical protein
MTNVERFWSCVKKLRPDQCWPWTGTVRGNHPQLYGFFYLDDGSVVSAHRFAFELQNGPIPELPNSDVRGTCIRHTCDNGICMNGRHLTPGTHLQNMRDKVERNRTNNGRAKLKQKEHQIALTN